jgi:predicted DNA-binding mobile mystery protein A
MAEPRFYSRFECWVRANRAAWVEIMQQRSWLRGLRQAQQLKGVELARRMGVSPARISMMERDEEQGALTLKMMQKAAQALDCEFVYVLIPKKILNEARESPPVKPRMRVPQGE